VYETNDSMLLAPTFEEEATRLASKFIQSYKQLPMRFYQIGLKYRKELRPKIGLIRQREFVMKDLYTFDIDEESAIQTYEHVNRIYQYLFKRIGINVVKVQASVGDMGGSHSHEYMMISEAGEDVILICNSCRTAYNRQIQNPQDPCKNCNNTLVNSSSSSSSSSSSPSDSSSSFFSSFPAIEVAHTFMLGDKYTKSLGMTVDSHENKRIYPHMGCYGVGVTRLIGAIAEVHNDQYGLLWPTSIAPYKMIGISKDPDTIIEDIFDLNDDFLVDDRKDISISLKVKDAYLLGIPNILVLGSDYEKSALVEFHHRSNPHEPKLIPMHEIKSKIMH